MIIQSIVCDGKKNSIDINCTLDYEEYYRLKDKPYDFILDVVQSEEDDELSLLVFYFDFGSKKIDSMLSLFSIFETLGIDMSFDNANFFFATENLLSPVKADNSKYYDGLMKRLQTKNYVGEYFKVCDYSLMTSENLSKGNTDMYITYSDTIIKNALSCKSNVKSREERKYTEEDIIDKAYEKLKVNTFITPNTPYYWCISRSDTSLTLRNMSSGRVIEIPIDTLLCAKYENLRNGYQLGYSILNVYISNVIKCGDNYKGKVKVVSYNIYGLALNSIRKSLNI